MSSRANFVGRSVSGIFKVGDARMTAMKILVVEDDRALARVITSCFTEAYDVDQAFDGEEGLFFARQDVYDLIVLDVMLPCLDGFGVIEKLKNEGIATPVLMLTARNAREDRLQGLRLGADDYLAKPFDQDELLLRVEAILRRALGVRTLDTLSFCGLLLDPNTRRAYVDGIDVPLKGKQYDILEYLLRHEGQLVSKTRLFDRVWGFMNETSSNVVEVYVSSLRKVLKPFGYEAFLKTIRGAGYIWTDNDEL